MNYNQHLYDVAKKVVSGEVVIDELIYEIWKSNEYKIGNIESPYLDKLNDKSCNLLSEETMDSLWDVIIEHYWDDAENILDKIHRKQIIE